MKKQPKKSVRKRMSLAAKIKAEPNFHRQRELAIYGLDGKNPFADFIGRWFFIKDYADEQSLTCLGNGDLEAGRRQHREAYDQHLQHTGLMFAHRIMARDVQFFRDFAKSLEAETKRPPEFTIEDPLRAALLLNKTVKPERSLTEIARMLNIEVRVVRKAARQLGLKPGKPGRPRK